MWWPTQPEGRNAIEATGFGRPSPSASRCHSVPSRAPGPAQAIANPLLTPTPVGESALLADAGSGADYGDHPLRLFLDIDGVLLGKDDPASSRVCLARHAQALLHLAVERFESWWLTTHSDGTIEPILRHLRPYCPPAVLDLACGIRPAVFKTLKTEALADAGRDFIWLDDAPLAVERQWLAERGLSDNWIAVDTRRNPDDLARVIALLERRLGSRA